MNPTGDDFKPRADGWYEHRGKWGEVTVGTVLADPRSRRLRWEVIATSHGNAQIPFGSTLWMRMREQTSGEEHSVAPRRKDSTVVILTQNPADTETPPAIPPSDTDAIMLLVEKLGATVLAQRDETTGEVVCPDYTYDSHLPRGHGHVLRGLVEHLRIAHGVQVSDDLDLVAAIEAHGREHSVAPRAGVGFPHRHIPEVDLNARA